MIKRLRNLSEKVSKKQVDTAHASLTAMKILSACAKLSETNNMKGLVYVGFMLKAKEEHQIIFVHNSLMGSSARIARMFSYPTTHMNNYYDHPQFKIVLLVRQSYLSEAVMPEKAFIEAYYDKIIGCVLADDKINGPTFGSKARELRELGIPIITILDRILTLDDKTEIERWLKKHA